MKTEPVHHLTLARKTSIPVVRHPTLDQTMTRLAVRHLTPDQMMTRLVALRPTLDQTMAKLVALRPTLVRKSPKRTSDKNPPRGSSLESRGVPFFTVRCGAIYTSDAAATRLGTSWAASAASSSPSSTGQIFSGSSMWSVKRIPSQWSISC
jgi:hypothetical protein